MNESKRRKILCPIDFSEHTEKTLAEAIAQAEKFGGEILFLHVLNQRSFEDLEKVFGRSRAFAGDEAEQIFVALGDERAEMMKDFLSKSRADRVPHKSIITRGYPFEEIIRLAESESVELIVMGVRGRSSRTREILVGSRANRVFRRAPCSVLFVR